MDTGSPVPLRPLEGVRVLDLSNVLAGPLGTYILALLGAEVIKVERPGTGDLARKMGGDPKRGRALMGTSFFTTNSNKRSITLNLQSTEGKEILLKLAARADVVFENFRPGTMKKLGLGYDTLKEINPRLVYCAVAGFGQEGPLAHRAAYDQIIQGFSGLMAMTGTEESAPLRAGFTVCDSVAAITAALATIAALYRQRATGEGAMIDVSMVDSSLVLGSWVISNYLNAGKMPVPMGNENHTAAPSGTFKTKDEPINIVCNEDNQFRALCKALGREDLLSHPVWSDRDERIANRWELKDMLDPLILEKTAAEWEEILVAHGVPCGRIYTVPQIVDHPHTAQRGFITEFADVPGTGGGAKVPGLGFRFMGEDLSPLTPPPQLGQDNDSVLGEIGYGPEQCEILRREHVI